MKPQDTLLTTAIATESLDANANPHEEIVAGSSNSHLLKNHLRRSIQLALAGSVLASGMASAVLLDHGPADATLTWPQWYRDTNGTALGICKSQAPSPNGAAGTMCFPPAFDPAGFAGNVGPEVFYNMVGFKNIANAGSAANFFGYRYVAGIEASYLPLGVPIHGTETVFARVRIALNFNNPLKNGTYRVIHPYGVEVFTAEATNNQNLFGANAAVFFTADVPLAATMNFDLALGGAIGPFAQWDVLNPGESLTAGGSTFVGDPNVPHTFSGSPFGTNFIRIEGPAGSNIGGPGIDFIEDHFGTVLGQVWGAPIAQALKIDGAYLSRSSTTNAIDVWATSAPNQKLFLTDTTTGGALPSVEMLPDGVVAGKYYAHIEYNSNITVPSSVQITNVTSNPIVSRNAVLTDGVEISTATFDTNTGIISIVAHSSNQIDNPALVAEGVPDVPRVGKTGAMTVSQCVSTPAPGDVCFADTLAAGVAPPESISVISTELGTHADHLVNILGNPDNQPGANPASDFTGVNAFSVASSGSTPLSNAAGSLPLDAVIITQPTNGIIALAGGTWIFTPTAAAVAGPDSFRYVRQTSPNQVSNVGAGELTLTFQSQTPNANLDQFAALVANPQVTTTLNVLSNDKAATTNPADQLDPASVTIVAAPTRGTATVMNGTIGYKAASGGADSFTYTVNNVAGQVSNTATVQMTNFTGPESVSVGKVTYTISQNKWVIVGSTNWFGPNLTKTTATCWTGTAAASTPSTLIGSAQVDTTGKFQVAPVGNTPVGSNGQLVTCQMTTGKTGTGTTSAK